jgi:hypothetical protein
LTGLHPLSEMQQNVICSLRSMPMADEHNPNFYCEIFGCE